MITRKIARYLSIAVIAVVYTMLTASCDVHEFPEVEEESEVTVNLLYEGSMPVYLDMTRTSSDADLYDTRYIVEFYRYTSRDKYSEDPVKRIVITREVADSLDYSITTTLPKGTYKVLAWTDYVDCGTQDDRFYQTIRLAKDVELIETVDMACNDFRDAFYGAITAKVEENSEVYTMNLTRPVAKFIIIANDFQKVAEKHLAKKGVTSSAANSYSSTYSVKFNYTGYMPSAYSVVNNYNIDAITGINFDHSFQHSISGNTANKSVELGFDYVFVNPTGGSLDVMVSVYDPDGEEMGRTSKIKVPLMQGEITIVRCSLEQGSNDAGGGTGINPDFEGPDYNLQL